MIMTLTELKIMAVAAVEGVGGEALLAELVLVTENQVNILVREGNGIDSGSHGSEVRVRIFGLNSEIIDGIGVEGGVHRPPVIHEFMVPESIAIESDMASFS